MTLQEWIEYYRGLPPELRSEANALIVAEAGMVVMLRAARGETGDRESRGETRGPTRMRSKRAGRCCVCRAGIIIGEDIYWDRERGAWHARCARA